MMCPRCSHRLSQHRETETGYRCQQCRCKRRPGVVRVVTEYPRFTCVQVYEYSKP
jgi:hypothetical protein